MAYANGRLPSSLLVTVEPKTRLLKTDAPVYFALRMYAANRGRTITIAGAGSGGGGGYRTWTMQDEMHKASLGNRTFAALYGLNPYSTVPLASAGFSSHGKADHARIDLVGTDLNWIVAHLAMFGMRREFGAADPNHVEVLDESRFRHTVPATGTSVTGVPGAFGRSNCWKRVQLLARLGGYTGPIDGQPAGHTWAALDRELAAGGFKSASRCFNMQRWAGITAARCVATSDWKKIPASNWRAIAKKLNRL